MAALLADWLTPKDRQDFQMEIGEDWDQCWKVTVGKSALPLDNASIEITVRTRSKLIPYTTSNGDLTIQGASVILNASGAPYVGMPDQMAEYEVDVIMDGQRRTVARGHISMESL